MKEMMKLQSTCGSNRVHHHQPSLAMHKHSHMISKFKPKIRIVHIFAPEIIKTDVSNFRELVQTLTGKPPTSSSNQKVSNKKPKFTSEEDKNDHQVVVSSGGYKLGFQSSGHGGHHHHNQEGIIKEEDQEASWGGENSSSTTSGTNNNYLFGGLSSDIDETFLQGYSHDFPLLPLSSTTHHMDMFGETYLA